MLVAQVGQSQNKLDAVDNKVKLEKNCPKVRTALVVLKINCGMTIDNILELMKHSVGFTRLQDYETICGQNIDCSQVRVKFLYSHILKLIPAHGCVTNVQNVITMCTVPLR